MTIFLIALGALVLGCLLPALVGLLGAQRRLGFALAFIISLIFTPVVGLIFVLLSEPLPRGSERNVGCVGGCLTMVGLMFMGFIILMLLGVLFLM